MSLFPFRYSHINVDVENKELSIILNTFKDEQQAYGQKLSFDDAEEIFWGLAHVLSIYQKGIDKRD